MSSIFTRIVKGEIPSYKIAENDDYYAFLDINPIARGHTLVIPKQETDYIFDLPSDKLQGLIAFAQKVAKGIDAAMKPIRTGMIVEGLEVQHAHIHLVPIYSKTQVVALGKGVVSLSKEDMVVIAKKIAERML